MRFAFGEYQLDTEARSLQRHGRRVSVEPKVFDVLAYLILVFKENKQTGKIILNQASGAKAQS